MEEGQVAKVGQDLCTIEVADDSAVAAQEDVQSSLTTTPPDDPVQHPDVPVQLSSSQTTHSRSTTRRPHPLDPNIPQEARAPASHGHDVLAAPSVRHYAREHRIDLSELAPGSGKDGRVEKRDVDAFLQGGAKHEATSHAAFRPGVAQDGQDTIVELNRTRHNMWKAMEKVSLSMSSVLVAYLTCGTEPFHPTVQVRTAHLC